MSILFSLSNYIRLVATIGTNYLFHEEDYQQDNFIDLEYGEESLKHCIVYISDIENWNQINNNSYYESRYEHYLPIIYDEFYLDCPV
jgi:hypothetical protein